MISTVIIFRELFKMLYEKVYSAPSKYRLYEITLNGSLALTPDTLCHCYLHMWLLLVQLQSLSADRSVRMFLPANLLVLETQAMLCNSGYQLQLPWKMIMWALTVRTTPQLCESRLRKTLLITAVMTIWLCSFSAPHSTKRKPVSCFDYTTS